MSETNPEEGDPSAVSSKVEPTQAGDEQKVKKDDGTNKDKGKKKNPVQMTYVSATQIERMVTVSLYMHNLSWKHLSCRQFYWFTMPQAVLTAVASVLAFVATSDALSDDEASKVILNLIVGSTASLVVFLQTMSGLKNYGTRAAMHQGAAVDLKDLLCDLHILKMKMSQVENIDQEYLDMMRGIQPKDPEADAEADKEALKYSETFGTIQSRLTQTLNACKSNIPMEISAAFNGLRTTAHLAMTKANFESFEKIYGHENFLNTYYSKADDILQGEILGSRFFPMKLPYSKVMVKKTMEILYTQFKDYDRHDFGFDSSTDDATNDVEKQGESK
ncbi:unnamed protein product [Pseudo-nitzschia multistriata]|uniref:Uncharacterized protein n=1 Tax=Pseudo-nitzschia multistriata TaxID=183589 RepID=A0A448ZQ84_9STRA|nr:unnamed protein product [Pseudo-nitzschia multistriata]